MPDHLVVGWPNKGVYKHRQITLAKQLFKAMDIPRENKEKRAWWLERGFRFFDAPAAIIIATDKVLGEAGPLLIWARSCRTFALRPCSLAWAPASRTREFYIRKWFANTSASPTKTPDDCHSDGLSGSGFSCQSSTLGAGAGGESDHLGGISNLISPCIQIRDRLPTFL